VPSGPLILRPHFSKDVILEQSQGVRNLPFGMKNAARKRRVFTAPRLKMIRAVIALRVLLRRSIVWDTAIP
jgi:hypothetical protein